MKKIIIISFIFTQIFCTDKLNDQGKCIMPEIFETKRLKAERVTDLHASYISLITSNDKIQEVYMTADRESFIDVSKQLPIIKGQWDTYGYGLYIIFDKKF